MSEQRNLIESTIVRSEKATGTPMSAIELATEFAKLSPAERVDHLVKIDDDLKRTDFADARAAARFHSYRRRLELTHKRLSAIDR
jgi:hypothetical protein